MAGLALVTGASAGIGRELARQLARDRGHTVLATARRRDRLEELAAEFPAGRIIPVAGDLADPAFRSDLIAQAESSPGGLAILINNAGLGRYDFFPDQDLAAIRQILEVNVVALCDLTRLALPGMIRRGVGQVVQISSVLGEFGVPYSAIYTASKHAVHGLVKCLRHELHGTGVRVWAACPSQTESEFRSVASGGPRVGRRGEPTDKVARGILRGLDRRRVFVYPTTQAAVVAGLAHWLPGPFAWIMGRWARNYFQREYLTYRVKSLP